MTVNKLAVLLLAAGSIGISGCGGGDSSAVTATGIFKDSNVSGMSYVSGGQSGVTGADGSFTYEVGQPVTFSINGVTIGTTSGASVVTPVSLISSGTTSTAEVQNIVRLLMMLDEDGDPANGISISSAVQALADDWSLTDFSAGAALEQFLIDAASAAATADSGTHTIPNTTAATTHLEGTMRCAYAGGFTGTYTGSGNKVGTFGLLIDAGSGDATGIGYNTFYSLSFSLSGNSPVTLDQNAGFAADVTAVTATYSGQFSDTNTMSGTWSDPSDSGTFSGSRIGGSDSAEYRFTGAYDDGANPVGVFTFDITGTTITGKAYEVATDTLGNISGTLSGSTISATTTSGDTITGTINTGVSPMTLTATWTGGGVSGKGCKLN